MTATAFDSSGNVLSGLPVSWQSTNTGVATVNGSGGVTAVSPGISVIFATISGVKGSLAFVVNPVPVGSVTISPHADTIHVLGQVQLTATVRDLNGNIIHPSQTWYSTNGSVAVVTSSGLVTGTGAGQAMIIDSAGGKADTNTTLVIAPVATVTLSPPSATITLTQTQALTATLKDASGNTLTGRLIIWTSSNHAVDTVSQSGIVYPVAPGTDTITASVSQSTGTVSGSATITVTLSAGRERDAEPPVGHDHAGPDTGAHRHAQGRQRCNADRTPNHLDQQQSRRRHRLSERHRLPGRAQAPIRLPHPSRNRAARSAVRRSSR